MLIMSLIQFIITIINQGRLEHEGIFKIFIQSIYFINEKSRDQKEKNDIKREIINSS
jgi:hypothetical protein